jgi:hypothetical protein
VISHGDNGRDFDPDFDSDLDQEIERAPAKGRRNPWAYGAGTAQPSWYTLALTQPMPN